MIITILITIVAVILFILFLSIILAGIADDNTTMAFIGIILTLLLCFGMDCNADVCEDIYKRDGYCSMQEEIQESHTAEKKKEQALHAKAISKDTYVFWTSEE